MADRLPVKLANESALGVYRFSWTSADGTRMEVQWGAGMGNPLMFRRDMAREIARPERFGWKTPRRAADFKRFAQAVASEFEAGYDDDELEELQARRGSRESFKDTPANAGEDSAAATDAPQSKFAAVTHAQPAMSADELRALAKRQQTAGDPHRVNTVQKADDLEGKPEWRRVADEDAAKSRAVGEVRADTSPYRQGPGAPAPQDVEITQRDRMSALEIAREVHFREATGLTIPRAGEFGLVGGRSDFNLAEQHLLSGDHAGGIAALNRALSTERAVRGRKTKAQQDKLANLGRFRDQVAEAASHPKDTLPVLARLPGGAPSGMTALDHNGAEYHISLNDGTVTVTRDGQTVSAQAGDDPTHTARTLAARLAEAPTAGNPEPATGQPGSVPSGTANAAHVPANKPGEAKEGAEALRTLHAPAAESFPQDRLQSLRPDNSAGTSSGQSAHRAVHTQPNQSPRATRGGGRS